VRAPDELASLAAVLAGAPAIAVDTEADSLHHYPAKLCLVQVATPDGRAWLVDPLALGDLDALKPVFADPAVTKVFHAADNDLAYLKRTGFEVAALFDTAIAARLVGHTSLGLDELLRVHLGLEPGKSRQKDDWSRRPLTPEQEAYAANDVLHLLPLRERLAAEVAARGRSAWLAEECAALAAAPPPARAADPDAYLQLKGAKALDGRGLAVLRELHRVRERLALGQDRPPFMILAHETLVALAARQPADETALGTVPGCTPRVIRRWGADILEAVRRGLAVPEADFPARPRPARPRVPALVRRRAEALRAWRAGAAERLGLEPGFLLPQRLIDRLAAAPPEDVDALERIDGLRQWRAQLLGADIVKVLHSA
jgi:ribonuclease D